MKLSSWLLLPLSLLVIAGCGGDGGGTGNDPGTARVRAINARQELDNIDVVADLGVITTNLGPSFASGYTSIPGVNQAVQVRVTGTTTAFASVNANFTEGNDYSFVVSNQANGTQPEIWIFQDDLSQPSGSNFKIRALNANPVDNASVDMYVTAANVNLADADPVAENIPFLQESAYITLPANGATTYWVRFTLTGTTDQLGPTAIITPAAGAVRTSLFYNNNGTGVRVLNDRG